MGNDKNDRRVPKKTSEFLSDEKKFYEKLGQNIRAARLEMDRTQRDIAELLFVSGDKVSHYESGLAKPSAYDIKLIAEFLDIEPNILLEYKGIESTSVDDKIYNRVKTMPKDDKEKLLYILEYLFPSLLDKRRVQ